MSSPSIRCQPHLLGIDEAGRGPVLGPMVYAYAACPISAKDELAAMGFADSKAINAQQRSALLHTLQHSPLLSHHTVVLSPQLLSADMQRAARVSLNVISHDAAIALIHHARDQAGLHLAEVYVDTVGDPRSYAAKLQAIFPDIRITVSAKADSLFPIVSAASIVAKCARDEAIQQWHFTELASSQPAIERAGRSSQQQQHDSIEQTVAVDMGEDETADVDSDFDDAEDAAAASRSAAVQSSRKRTVASMLDADGNEQSGDVQRSDSAVIDRDMGSGYPGDPATKRWLVRHVDAVFGFPSIVRFSWATARQLLQAKAYGVTWHDALDDEQTADERSKSDAATQRLDRFMSAATHGREDSKDQAARTSSSTVASKERVHYFQQRHIDILTSFT